MTKRLVSVLVALTAVAATAAGAFAADGSVRLQALLDKGGEVRFPAGEFTVDKTLVVRPGTHLVCAPGFRARLADGANCAILANADAKTNLVADISVEGGLWDGNNVHQDRAKYSEAGHTPPLRYGARKYGQLIAFSGVKGLRLKGLTVKDPQGFSIQLTDVEDFAVEDITFDCNDRTGNEDGVHVNGFARHGVIRGIRGHTNDDLVALNSDEGDFRTGDCTIEDVHIEDLDGGERGYTGVRLLSRHAHVRNVTIRNVRGKFQFNAVSFTHWAGENYEPGMGHFDNILIEDVTATSCHKASGGHGGLIWFQEGVQDVGTVTIRRLRREEGPEYRNQVHTIDIGDNVRIRELRIENVSQSIPDDKPLIRRAPSSKVGIVRDRAETLAWFLRNEYGVRPAAAEKPEVSFEQIVPDREVANGLAVRKRIRVNCRGPHGTNSFVFSAFIPKSERPVPATLLLCNRAGVVSTNETVETTGEFWPYDEIVRRGYAAIAFYLSDLANETYVADTALRSGVFAAYERFEDRRPDSWGVLSAWAWGASRVMDWLVAEPSVDAARTMVIGHSRGGKAALVAGVTDERFAMVVSNNSGTGGARLNRMNLPFSEPWQAFDYWGVSYWFCGNCRETFVPYNGMRVEHDQDEWLSLVAPRILAVGSGADDKWAGPEGERAATEKAAETWKRMGVPGNIDYWMRPGGHGLTAADWKHYLDFADRRMGKK